MTETFAPSGHGRHRKAQGHELLAARLDCYGVTLVNFIDPVDGSTVAGIDAEQIRILMSRLAER